MTGVRPVVLVDDDDDARAATAQLLLLSDFTVQAFADPRAALPMLEAGFAGILVTDVRMPHMSGIEMFEAVRARDPELPVILVTGHGDVPMAVAALKAGAWDFLSKPFHPDALVAAATRAATARALVIENRRLAAEADRGGAGAMLVGDAPAIRRLRAMLPTLADADVDMVIEGESGTGKTLYARALHRSGRRARQRLTVVDCATVPPAIVGRELFGHGGTIARADRGTLLLAGLDRASDALQDQLVRFVAERAVGLDTRTPDAVDVRIVATIGEGRREAVRPELYHRLAVATVRMPPLAERRGDVPLIFATLVQRAATDAGVAVPPLGDVALRLGQREWPGNVRELANHAERVCRGIESVADMAADVWMPLPDRLDAFERAAIVAALADTGYDATQAARLLGLPRKTFYNRVGRLGIDLARLRGQASAGGGSAGS